MPKKKRQKYKKAKEPSCVCKNYAHATFFCPILMDNQYFGMLKGGGGANYECVRLEAEKMMKHAEGRWDGQEKRKCLLK